MIVFVPHEMIENEIHLKLSENTQTIYFAVNEFDRLSQIVIVGLFFEI